MNCILLDFRENWLNLLPFSFTRPIGKFRIGIFTIEEKWNRYLNTQCSFITEEYLTAKYPAVTADINLVINSILLPDKKLVQAVKTLADHEMLYSGDLFLAGKIAANDLYKLQSGETKGYAIKQYSGAIVTVRNNWDIFLLNGDEIKKDAELVRPSIKPYALSGTNVVIGDPANLLIDEGVNAECVVFNVTDGPIYIGKEALLMEGSMIKGPSAIGEHTMVKMGAKIYQGTTIGPYCRAGGEINNSVFFGYSNKSHDGFLGNAVLGEWCNLGADTNNSNLKNNYEKVKVWNYRQKSFIDSGLTFCGLFMGDHSKCAINTMFNTGTTVGVSANIFGSGFPRTFIPSFTWGGSQGFIDYDIEKVLATARIVMGRRDVSLDAEDEKILRTIFDQTKEFRK